MKKQSIFHQNILELLQQILQDNFNKIIKSGLSETIKIQWIKYLWLTFGCCYSNNQEKTEEQKILTTLKLKRCSRCFNIYSTSEFSYVSYTKDNFNLRCKICIQEYHKLSWIKLQNNSVLKNIAYNKHKERRWKYKQRIQAHGKMYNQLNKKKRKLWSQKYYKNNKDKIRKYSSEYYHNNVNNSKEKRLAYAKTIVGKSTTKKWRIKKMKTDIQFVISTRLRGMMRRAVKLEKTEKILGCSFGDFKIYFESLFTHTMTWKEFLSGEIHIDHIIPLKMFNLTDPTHVKCANFYINLQPLYKKDNFKKSSKLPTLDVINKVKYKYKCITKNNFICLI